MIELSFFTQEINKKFQNEIWADYEAKLFEKNLFIKCGIDLSYSHQFELYIENVNIDKIPDKWTVDLRKNKILYFKNKEIFFISDENETIKIQGKKYLVNLKTTIYHFDLSDNVEDCIINPNLLNLSNIVNFTTNNHFIQLKL